MKRLFLVLAMTVGFSSCLPWDFRYDPKWDYPVYPRSTPFDRFKAARLAEKSPVVVAGAGKADITPPKKKGVYMAGYQSNRRSTGVLDPLSARCALVDDGRETVVFVSVDLIGLFYDDIADVRHLVSTEHGDAVIVTSVHNHEGPDTMGIWGKSPFYTIPVKTGIDPDYQRFLKDRMAKCVFDAAQSARPATFRAGAAEVPEGISENYRKTGFKENTMTLLEAVDAAGKSIFTLANWPMHVEALDEGNNLISADWAGVMYREFEKNHDGVLVYLQGALGGMIAPRMSKYAPQHEKRRFMEVAGRVVAETARRGLDGGAEKVEVRNVVRKKAPVWMPLENDDLVLAQKLGLMSRESYSGAVRSEIDYVEIGPAKFATVPGEALPAVGFKIKEMLGARHSFVVGPCMDELGYILPKEYWTDPLYEYERSVSAGPKTADIVTETLRGLIESR
jgi:hypothetical protein